LASNYEYCFLSRPRRFGKSLFLDTLQEIFEGNRKLFKGLYIYDKWDWREKYPVIKISFTGNRDIEGLKQSIFKNLDFAQKKLGIDCQLSYDYATCFSDLIQKTYEKYQKRVVILIDEYDKPILDNLDQIEIAKESREILKILYTQIKDNDRYIKFAFLTGVSKFSKASIFSGLNNLRDISLLPKFGTICGYTQKNIENEFLPYLEGVDLEKLKSWYNGYNFLSNKVYNPFDILLFIDSDFLFKNYWFETGTPSFLIKLFKEGRYNLAEFEELLVEDSLLNSFDIEYISFETVMFQSGYLTIKNIENSGNDIFYYLTFPNIEIKKSFSDYLLNTLFVDRMKKAKVQYSLYKILKNSDLDQLEKVLKALFASIAYNNFTNNYIQNYEGFYASIIYAYFAGTGVDNVKAEDITNSGRIDLSLFIDDKIYIFEFKVDNSGALEQIKKKKYYEKYLDKYKEVYLIGVEFNSKERNLIKYEWERVS
jgi:hypothetical protein